MGYSYDAPSGIGGAGAGALSGGAMGGPVGAIIGALVGAAAGMRKDVEYTDPPGWLKDEMAKNRDMGIRDAKRGGRAARAQAMQGVTDRGLSATTIPGREFGRIGGDVNEEIRKVQNDYLMALAGMTSPIMTDGNMMGDLFSTAGYLAGQRMDAAPPEQPEPPMGPRGPGTWGTTPFPTAAPWANTPPGMAASGFGGGLSAFGRNPATPTRTAIGAFSGGYSLAN